MNKKVKVFFITCIIAILLGVLFMGIGAALGGTGNIELNIKNLRFTNGNNGHVIKNEKATERFSGIDIDAAAYQIELINGDEYKIEYAYNEKIGEPTITVKDSILYIEDPASDIKIKDMGDVYLRVYYPINSKFKDVKINCNLGEIQIENLKCKNLDVSLDCGDMNINHVNIENGDIILKLGDFDAKDFYSRGLTVKALMGEIDMEGSFYGINNIDCKMGDINIKTSVSKSKYNYDIKTSLGDVKVDDTNSGSQKFNDSQIENDLIVNNNMGDIKVKFGNEIKER